MGLFDVILLIIIAGFALFGLWFGFIHTLGSLFGTLLGVYLASRYYDVLSVWLVHITGWDGNAARVIMFILAFFVINRLVGLVFWLVDRLLSIVTRLPFLSSINRMGGLVAGFLEGLITVGIAMILFDQFPFSERITAAVQESWVVPIAVGSAQVILALVPSVLERLNEAAAQVEGWL